MAVCAAALLVRPAEGAVSQVRVVGAKYDQRRSDTASTIVIGKEELMRHGDRTLADVLVRVPGLTVDAKGIRMRGLGNGYTQVLLDGVAMPAGFALESLAPELIERIDIVKTASAELGMQAIAGTVNIVMKKNGARARDTFKFSVDSQRGYQSPSLSGQLAVSSSGVASSLAVTLGRTRVLTSSIDHEMTQVGVPATVNQRRTDRFEINTADTLNLVPRINGKFGANELSVRGLINLHRRRAYGDNHETLIAGTHSAVPDSALQYTPSANNLQLEANWQRALGSGAKMEFAAGSATSRRKASFAFSALPRAGAEATSVDSRAREDDDHAGGKYSVTVTGNHQLVAGWEHKRVAREQTRSGNDMAAQGQYQTDRYAATTQRSALFIQDDWQGEHGWSVSAGMRADALQSRVAQAGESVVTQSSTVLGPVLQTLYKTGPGGLWRLGLTRTYKAPAIAALIPRRYKVDNNNGPSNPDTQGNPSLRPELAWGLDLGYEHYLGKHAMFSVSGFARRINHVTGMRLTLDQYGWVAQQANQGRANASGVLVEAKFPWRQWAPDSADIDVRLSAARNWSRVHAVPSPHNRLDGQDPSSANLALDYRPAAMPLTLSANLNYLGGSMVRWSEQVSARTSPSRVVDLHAVWTPRRDVRLRAGILNILAQDRGSTLSYLRDTTTTHTSVAAKGSVSMRLGFDVDLH